MKKLSTVILLISGLLALATPLNAQTQPNEHPVSDEYTLVVTGYDWGPAVNKVILDIGDEITETNADNYSVAVERSSHLSTLPPERSTGALEVINAYISTADGDRVATGEYLTLVISVNPDNTLGSPMEYINHSNHWIDYKLIVTQTSTNRKWTTEANRIRPVVDKFDLSGTYIGSNGRSLTYASYEPEIDNEKSPLIIWLHGGGEGGTDPSTALMANKASNYASDEIQLLFGGAYVLAPQTPTFWMQNADGQYTVGQVDDVQNGILMDLIKHYVATHPGIDSNRIYIGGCSNGGYMSLKLILLHPDYFAAGYISALAYHAQYITDEQVESIKDVPIWFVQSKDDTTTVPNLTAIPMYERLQAAGASDVHFSLFDHVTDLSGLFGGKDYWYHGHFSWIYSHANACRLDYDGTPVLLDGRPTTIMEWMAAKHN